MGSNEVARDGQRQRRLAGRVAMASRRVVGDRDAAIRYRLRMLVARVVVMALVLGVPFALGARLHAVTDDDMAPVLRVGDALVTWPLAAAAATPGDLVTFPHPDDPGRIITRRVVEVAPSGPVLVFETGGYPILDVERWHLPADARIGAVSRRLPLLGHPLTVLARPAGYAALIALVMIPAAGLAVLARPPRRPLPRRRASPGQPDPRAPHRPASPGWLRSEHRVARLHPSSRGQSTASTAAATKSSAR